MTDKKDEQKTPRKPPIYVAGVIDSMPASEVVKPPPKENQGGGDPSNKK